jgi:hypothetical protein
MLRYADFSLHRYASTSDLSPLPFTPRNDGVDQLLLNSCNDTYISNLDQALPQTCLLHLTTVHLPADANVTMILCTLQCGDPSYNVDDERQRPPALHPGMMQSGQEPGTYLHKKELPIQGGYIFLQGHKSMHYVNFAEMSTTREV